MSGWIVAPTDVGTCPLCKKPVLQGQGMFFHSEWNGKIYNWVYEHIECTLEDLERLINAKERREP